MCHVYPTKSIKLQYSSINLSSPPPSPLPSPEPDDCAVRFSQGTCIRAEVHTFDLDGFALLPSPLRNRDRRSHDVEHHSEQKEGTEQQGLSLFMFSPV